MRELVTIEEEDEGRPLSSLLLAMEEKMGISVENQRKTPRSNEPMVASQSETKTHTGERSSKCVDVKQISVNCLRVYVKARNLLNETEKALGRPAAK
ncbi:hypothetical protein R1flu_023257 [Riccia fluitans]|uniref:Uncharacterized protein n=1 Tax=Riccia fluitans TaxID=41844 RepID=A0ABD1XRK4_9MARC